MSSEEAPNGDDWQQQHQHQHQQQEEEEAGHADGEGEHLPTLLYSPQSPQSPQFQTKEEQLWEACTNGALSVVRTLLRDDSVNVNYADSELRRTCFYRACGHGRTEVVKAMLYETQRVNVNIPMIQDASPFYIACQQGHVEVVRLLLADPRIDVTMTEADDCTPLFVACSHNRTEVVKVLLQDPRINVNRAQNQGCTPLVIACQEGYSNVVRALLQHPGLDVNARDETWTTAFHVACLEGHEETVRLFLPDNQEDVHVFPRHLLFNQPRHLLFNQPQPHQGPSSGKSPTVHWSAEPAQGAAEPAVADFAMGNTTPPPSQHEEASVGLDQAEEKKRQATGQTGPHGAVKQDPVPKQLRVLDPNLPDDIGIAPLYSACQEGHENIVKLLLNDRRVDVNAANAEGITPLWICAQEGRLQLIKWMLFLRGDEVKFTARTNHGAADIEDVDPDNEAQDGLGGAAPLIDPEDDAGFLPGAGGPAADPDVGVDPAGLAIAAANVGEGEEEEEEGEQEAQEPEGPAPWHNKTATEWAMHRGHQVCAALIEEYQRHRERCRKRLERELGVTQLIAAKLFWIMVFFADGYLVELSPGSSSTSPQSTPPSSEVVRFFRISSRLPLEIQMVLANRTNLLSRDLIPVKEREAAFKTVLSDLMS